MKVAVLQMDVAFGAPEKNIANFYRLTEQAMAQRPDVLLLPEAFLLPAAFCKPSKIRKIPILGQKSSIRKHGHLGTFCQRTFQNKFC